MITPTAFLRRLLPLIVAAVGVVDAASDSRPMLAPVFADHMVLQRGKPNPFWGWAAPGQKVHVIIADHVADAVAAADGRWQAAVEVPPAGGPYEARIEAGETVVLHDVLVGDVWLCGGQSNMELPLAQTDVTPAELVQANRPNIRLCQVRKQVSYAPAATVQVEWKTCTAATAGRFSAVAYYFAQKLESELHVPIGLISANLGGSPAESWTSAATLTHIGEFSAQLAEIARLNDQGGPTYGSFLMHWLDEHDAGGRDAAWARPDLDDRDWTKVSVPGGFGEVGVPTEPTIVWFRREVTLPDPLPVGAVRIRLGVVERMDTVFVNGKWTGASSWVENPRVYPVPNGALRPGRNVIAVRVFKTKPNGGFMSPAADLKLELPGGRTIPLAGDWRAKLSYDARPPATLPLDFDNYPTMPAVLYNGMIAPLAPLSITGAIWYQGEANTTRPAQYRKLLPAMIADWRATFGQGDFPFYVVGLPAFMERRTQPGSDGWAELRDAQAWTVRTVRNTALAVTIDTGDAGNIHPRNKRPVGERLALCALADHYGQSIVASGPTLRLIERRPGHFLLHFEHAEGGLKVHGDALEEFSVVGADGQWHWAKAHIVGDDTVELTCAEVPEPRAARYAWQGNPRATLFNGAGLPAAPFTTEPPAEPPKR